MAEKAEKKPEAAPAAATTEKKEQPKGGMGAMMGKTPVLLGVAMIIEAAVLFAGFKMLGGGPKHASADTAATADEHGGEHGGGEHGAKPSGEKSDKKIVEIPVLVNFHAINKVRGQAFQFEVSITVMARPDNEEKIKTAIKDREALIKDRLRTIIAQSDPEKLGGGTEPGLETLRRQVKHQLDEIVGEGMIDEVLVPRCIPFRLEF